MNNLDKQYQDLLRDILDNGTRKQTRNGEVISVFGRTIRHDMKEGFPLLTTKKMAFKNIVTELLWFLRGSSDLRELVNDGNYIWVGDAYAFYLNEYKKDNSIGRALLTARVDGKTMYQPLDKELFVELIKVDDHFNSKWGNLGRIYGVQWRSWNAFTEYESNFDVIENTDEELTFSMSNTGLLTGIDQITKLIYTLKTNPDDRRMIVTAWNPPELDEMILPPCHYGFQVYTRELTHEHRYAIYNSIFKDRCTPDCYTPEEFDKHNIPKRAISLLFNMRSNDFLLGNPYNLASYGLLLKLIAHEVNMVPDELIANLGDVHVYKNQLGVGVMEQLERDPYKYELPEVEISNDSNWTLTDPKKTPLLSDINLVNYKSYGKINFPLSN